MAQDGMLEKAIAEVKTLAAGMFEETPAEKAENFATLTQRVRAQWQAHFPAQAAPADQEPVIEEAQPEEHTCISFRGCTLAVNDLAAPSRFSGHVGNDSFLPGEGATHQEGKAGNDFLHAATNAASTLIGGSGKDTYTLDAEQDALIIEHKFDPALKPDAHYFDAKGNPVTLPTTHDGMEVLHHFNPEKHSVVLTVGQEFWDEMRAQHGNGTLRIDALRDQLQFDVTNMADDAELPIQFTLGDTPQITLGAKR